MDQSDVRASDQDREMAAGALRIHFTAGRLDSDELDERVAGAYSTKTRGDLDVTLAQLPALALSLVQQRAALLERCRLLRARALQRSAEELGRPS
jgi:hypothetical protein